MEIFDLRNKTWIQIENLAITRRNFSSVLLGYKLMLFGGTNINNSNMSTFIMGDKTVSMN